MKTELRVHKEVGDTAMKYKSTDTTQNGLVIYHHLVDDNGNHCSFVEWPEDNRGEQATTYNYDGGHIKIDYHIKLNKDNPQESIDRIKKLAVLK
jgi:hypothetical protein